MSRLAVGGPRGGTLQWPSAGRVFQSFFGVRRAIAGRASGLRVRIRRHRATWGTRAEVAVLAFVFADDVVVQRVSGGPGDGSECCCSAAGLGARDVGDL